jgi:hypothetical protein
MAAPSNRAEQYARLFRKAGVLAGKGKRADAVTVLEQGAALARAAGDTAMQQVFREQIVTHQREEA